MTILEAISTIHYLFQKDQEVPDAGSDEYVLYTSLIDSGINIWENQEGLRWPELYGTDTGTITSADATYPLAANFRFPAGLLTIGSTEYQFQTPEESYLTSIMSGTVLRYTITGAIGSKSLTVSPTPGVPEDGATWTLPYYKTAATFASGGESTVIEMSDPYFAVQYALANLWLPKNQTIAGVAQQIADQKLTAMRIHAQMKPLGARPVHSDITYAGFGV